MKQNLIGQKFNEWTVLERVSHEDDYAQIYLCECSCENKTKKEIREDRLLNDMIKNCGCIKRENGGRFKKTHGKTGHRLHNIFLKMKRRCYSRTDKSYDNYGARGITICDEWLNDFMSFYNWSIENGYSDELSIDRIDNDKGYSPDNCRWTTPLVQQNNTRWNNFIEINGEKKSVSQWSKISGVSRQTIIRRLERGLSGNELLEPVIKVKAEKQSGVQNVKWDKHKERWKLDHRIEGKVKHIGYFRELDDAIRAREEYFNNLDKVN